MKDKEIEIQKVCGFYVNDWHFTTMILPYVRKEIEGNKKVITFFQESMKAKVEEILSKMNLNKTFEKKILEINWKQIKQEEIEQTLKLEKENMQMINIVENEDSETGKENMNMTNRLKEEIKENRQMADILVKGDNEFIETINEKIETAMKELGERIQITIINFYDLSQNNEINQITKQHEYVMNTAGMQKIEKETKQKKEA
ncbi:MAG: hypothetical protein HFJ26_03200 [Clostridia bacterium]|jgi:hypothetical protein|nr:hypothetical protein [Clostridia bacterium]